jgi:hypothetical protein
MMYGVPELVRAACAFFVTEPREDFEPFDRLENLATVTGSNPNRTCSAASK